MKLKTFLAAFSAFITSTTVLYLIDYIFTIPWLMIHYDSTNNESGFYLSIGSFVPLLIGLGISFSAEQIYVMKDLQKYT